jgi:hypothetical protein
MLRAKRVGRIESAARVLQTLRRAGLHLDDRLVRAALAEVLGEGWEP